MAQLAPAELIGAEGLKQNPWASRLLVSVYDFDLGIEFASPASRSAETAREGCEYVWRPDELRPMYLGN